MGGINRANWVAFTPAVRVLFDCPIAANSAPISHRRLSDILAPIHAGSNLSPTVRRRWAPMHTRRRCMGASIAWFFLVSSAAAAHVWLVACPHTSRAIWSGDCRRCSTGKRLQRKWKERAFLPADRAIAILFLGWPAKYAISFKIDNVKCKWEREREQRF
jgi:hypothetical protein